MIVDVLKKQWIHLLALLIFAATALIMFYPQFQGKKLTSSDYVQWEGMAKEAKTYEEKTGEATYWTNSMFGGMPTYFTFARNNTNLLSYVRKATMLGFKGNAARFVMGMVCFYILMLVLRVKPTLAIIGALAFAFSTNNLVLLNAGHVTKISTVLSSPLLIAGIITAYRKDYLLGLLLFSVGMGINLACEHPQMTYYVGMMMLIYVALVFVKAIKDKSLVAFAKSSGVLVIGLLLALGSYSWHMLPILEYQSDTMRGSPILEASTSQTNSSSNVDGLAWDYAMNWSNGWEDILSSFIPHAVGGSSGESISDDYKFAKTLKKLYRSNGMSVPKKVQAPMYWGALPGTSGPIYFGAIIFMLFFMSLFYVKGNLKWWAFGAVLLTLLMSLGKNFEFFNRIIFEYFPLANKFRTPNSVLSVTMVVISLLAIFGLNKMLDDEDVDWKKVLLPGAGLMLFTLLIGLAGPAIFDMSSLRDAQMVQQLGMDPMALEDDRAKMLFSSALRSALYMLATLVLLWASFKGIFKKIYALILIGILSFVDFATINSKYINADSYVTPKNYKRNAEPRSVDLEILKDPDPYYRVLDNSVNTFNSAFPSNFHKSVGGYHAAKMQRYMDMIDYHISKNNQDVLNMLNTKYVIYKTSQDGPEQVQRNTGALGNAWFVNSVKIVNSPNEEIEALGDFEPLGEAIVHKEFTDYVEGLNGPKNGDIELVKYSPNELTYKSNSSSDQLAVFSDIWYGPNKGWQAYIDGQKVDHIRVNYILRALKVPAGSHDIKFVFEPSTIKIGNIISLISSLIILLIMGLYFWTSYKNMKIETKDEESISTPKIKSKAKLKK